MMGALRVTVADGQALFRQGLVRLLGDAGFDVVGDAATATTALTLIRKVRPDVAVIDVRLRPDRADDGLRVALAVRAKLPDVGVLVLSQHLEERYVLELIGDDARGVGYLLKDHVADIDAFADAIGRVAAGGSALDPEVVAHIVGRPRPADPLASLTGREREVLVLMAEGLTNRGIAARLDVSVGTVEKHATNTFAKLAAGRAPDEHPRVMAVLTQLRAGGPTGFR